MPWSMSTSWHEMKNKQKLLGFSYIYKIEQILKPLMEHFIEQKPLISEVLGAENPLRFPFSIHLKKTFYTIPLEFESGITIQPAVVASLHLLHDQLRILPNHLGEFSVFCPVLFRPELFPNRRKQRNRYSVHHQCYYCYCQFHSSHFRNWDSGNWCFLQKRRESKYVFIPNVHTMLFLFTKIENCFFLPYEINKRIIKTTKLIQR